MSCRPCRDFSSRAVKPSHKWLGYFHPVGKATTVFCADHVESPTLQFLFEDTTDAALARWNRGHLPHREKLSP